MASAIENVAVDLHVDDGAARPRLAGEPPFKLAHERGKRFRFELCRKQTLLGEVPLDQWWMRQQGLYGERNQDSPNREAIIGYYWALCHKHLTLMHEDVQESYILMNLLPHARSNGSRRVFVDATLARSKKYEVEREEMAREVEDLLHRSPGEELDEVQFHGQTANFLGPPVYEPPVWAVYERFCDDVLGEAREALVKDGKAGLQVALDRWAEKMRCIGRRRGRQTEKQVLDILSYEARAALHRCYAAVWFDLIPALANEFTLSEESASFHRLWHLLLQRDSNLDEANFYPFHGHIFALHPACGVFMQTTSGPWLIGRWAQDPRSVPKYQQVLYAMSLAMYVYADRYGVCAQLRKRQPTPLAGADHLSAPKDEGESDDGQGAPLARGRGGARQTG